MWPPQGPKINRVAGGLEIPFNRADAGRVGERVTTAIRNILIYLAAFPAADRHPSGPVVTDN